MHVWHSEHWIRAWDVLRQRERMREVTLNQLLRVLEDPPPQVWCFAKETPRTPNVVQLLAVINYTERIQRKSSEGKRCLGQSLGETRPKLPEPSPSGDPGGCPEFL